MPNQLPHGVDKNSTASVGASNNQYKCLCMKSYSSMYQLMDHINQKQTARAKAIAAGELLVDDSSS